MGKVPVQPPSAPVGCHHRMQSRGAERRRCVMRILLAAILLAVTALVCPTLLAGVGEGLAERIQDLNLTDAQEAKIAEIRKECQVKIQQARTALSALVKEEVEKVRDVLTTAQKQKLQDLK